MKTLTTTGLGALFMAVFATACSSASSSGSANASSGDGAGSGNAGSSCKAITACGLLSASAIDQALGNGLTVTDPTETDDTGGNAMYECIYSPTASPTVTLTVTCNAAGSNTPDFYTTFNGVFGGTAVSGVGEAAFFSGSTTGESSTLVAFFGDSGQLSLLIYAPATVDHEAVSKTLANMVLAQL
jgi:hypothetical protein